MNSNNFFSRYFADKNTNYTRQFFNLDGSRRCWELIKQEYVFDEKYKFKWMQTAYLLQKS